MRRPAAHDWHIDLNTLIAATLLLPSDPSDVSNVSVHGWNKSAAWETWPR